MRFLARTHDGHIHEVLDLLLTQKKIGIPFDGGVTSYLDLDEVTIMQSTGKKDRNGKEIYGGMLVTISFSFTQHFGEVVYSDDRAAWGVEICGVIFPLSDADWIEIQERL